MAGLFDPNKPVPPEVIEAMVNVSTNPEERKQLEKQLAMARQLVGGATEYRNMPGQRAVGGIANAASQAAQGYMGGTMMAEDAKRSKELMDELRKGRRSYYDLSNAQMPNPYAPPMPYSE